MSSQTDDPRVASAESMRALMSHDIAAADGRGYYRPNRPGTQDLSAHAAEPFRRIGGV